MKTNKGVFKHDLTCPKHLTQIHCHIHWWNIYTSDSMTSVILSLRTLLAPPSLCHRVETPFVGLYQSHQPVCSFPTWLMGLHLPSPDLSLFKTLGLGLFPQCQWPNTQAGASGFLYQSNYLAHSLCKKPFVSTSFFPYSHCWKQCLHFTLHSFLGRGQFDISALTCWNYLHACFIPTMYD